MAIEGPTMELVKFFTIWVITMFSIYMPHFWSEAGPTTKVNLNLLHITIILPVLLNAIARGTRGLDAIAVDWAFLITALVLTFLFMYSIVQAGGVVKDSAHDFGKDSASTGTTLGLSLMGFMISLFLSRLAYDGEMYKHKYA